jgi:hypothetical protein
MYYGQELQECTFNTPMLSNTGVFLEISRTIS